MIAVREEQRSGRRVESTFLVQAYQTIACRKSIGLGLPALGFVFRAVHQKAVQPAGLADIASPFGHGSLFAYVGLNGSGPGMVLNGPGRSRRQQFANPFLKIGALVRTHLTEQVTVRGPD